MMNNAPAKGLAERLDAWPKARVWLIILMAALGLLFVNLTFPRVDTGPLYVPLVCAAAWAFRRRESLLVAAIATASNFIPLIVESSEAATGALVGSAAVRFSILVFVIAIIVSFRRAYDRQRFLARRDPLTGAANKATFEQHADKVLDAPADRTMLLTTIDLDNFKAINDTHGHAAGDAVVRAFAAKAAAATRKEDCLGRIGGDEFALLGPVSSVEDGHTTAACLHRRLSGVLSELPYPVTISMGAIVIPPQSGLDRATLMNHADQLMYAVKRAGKGAVMVDTVAIPSQAHPRGGRTCTSSQAEQLHRGRSPFALLAMAEGSGWNADDGCSRLHVACDDGACADDSTFAQSKPLKDRSVQAHEHARLCMNTPAEAGAGADVGIVPIWQS